MEELYSMLADGTAANRGGFDQSLLMILVALVFLYVILWRPEQKRRKALEAKRQGLKKGDQVIAAGGILGEITKVEKDTVVLKLIDGAKIEVLKMAVQDVQPSSAEAKQE